MKDFNKWAQNLYEQLENDRKKLQQIEPRSFSRVDFNGQKKRETYSSLEQWESHFTKVRSEP